MSLWPSIELPSWRTEEARTFNLDLWFPPKCGEFHFSGSSFCNRSKCISLVFVWFLHPQNTSLYIHLHNILSTYLYIYTRIQHILSIFKSNSPAKSHCLHKLHHLSISSRCSLSGPAIGIRLQRGWGDSMVNIGDEILPSYTRLGFQTIKYKDPRIRINQPGFNGM